ncbi:helix-turn-helix domain-containing protein [Clostridium perfringens]|uniref:helix-turn-helix domain-containing protein n=1 Tax=Clostridium perfringens TaxID=1502 RepID=UPI0018E4274E|nr:helix-turn-helix transcriptional regulator [Clostridium perfringens]MBI5993935.1 helix-turn-helix transcriptional regulator [Clostridium perfringens]MBI6055076.1 helix-turn-helix transcriptional regulator [Clostridium perfringens]MDK0590710.1 helix-turn-helix transcriptional regulator [Clostridium perfringens]MDK0596211.1 helix-turn-helix transcriptional regulator [Clostridium perfringens]MDK0666903.1 helix-turn-helix transcriptional regulator [Clostridium perfringens]
MFYKRLRQLRESKELSQKDLADILKVGPSTVSMWEQGKRIPDSDMLIILANYFNVSIDYLLGRTNDKNIIEIDKDTITLGEKVDSYLRENGINPDEMTEEQREDIAEQFVKLFIAFNKDK